MLFLVRTHYIIDLITGVIFAHIMFMNAERLSFVLDVLALGIAGGRKRFRAYFKPCKCCGWGNKGASDFMEKEEKNILKELYNEKRGIFKTLKVQCSSQEAEREAAKS